jgi:thymidylate synthase (FAD)
MKIFTEPEVFLIAYPHINYDGLVAFLTECGYPEAVETIRQDPSMLVELGGRMCFGSYKKFGQTSDLIEHAVNLGHGSIFEHACFTFAVARDSRGYTHQQVRHRAGFAYSQESTHYIKYSPEMARFCVEPYMYDTPEKRALVDRAMENSIAIYSQLYDLLKAEEQTKHNSCGAARAILPNGIEGKILITANARAWRHFIEERGNTHNTLEIRVVACKVLTELRKVAKPLMYGLELFEDVDGRQSVKTLRKKI